MGKGLEIFGEVRIVDETNCFGMDFVKETENGFWSANLTGGTAKLFVIALCCPLHKSIPETKNFGYVQCEVQGAS